MKRMTNFSRLILFTFIATVCIIATITTLFVYNINNHIQTSKERVSSLESNDCTMVDKLVFYKLGTKGFTFDCGLLDCKICKN